MSPTYTAQPGASPPSDTASNFQPTVNQNSSGNANQANNSNHVLEAMPQTMVPQQYMIPQGYAQRPMYVQAGHPMMAAQGQPQLVLYQQRPMLLVNLPDGRCALFPAVLHRPVPTQQNILPGIPAYPMSGAQYPAQPNYGPH
ncbi:hypothetical protein AGDE_14722 [Angomonas deanei]|uniref:Uncharacterized protein n=1 Tax=Angomonas deanei TaxID=59799 RepID=A0A7G2BZZ8_9TRYP|nr:hypothetical protein AGDE_14722 [Angomonas deanei]CAD2213040.1 hypothetical protein, conserved [Angomonas deanei]|eukprot:EPY20355.1 hypothetical protein AGDE_14722 [Angomonas deanei]